MATKTCIDKQPKGLSVFERYLTLWVILCIVAGIILGKIAPGVATYLDGLAIYVGKAPVVSIPIAVCLFFMMYPIMVKIDFAEVVKAGKNAKPVGLTLFVNWAIKPFTMYGLSIGEHAEDHGREPVGESVPAEGWEIGTKEEEEVIKLWHENKTGWPWRIPPPISCCVDT